MRYFAACFAICVVGFSSWATAAPFDEISKRLDSYDDGEIAPRQTRTRDRVAGYQDEPIAGNDGGPTPDGSVWDEGCDEGCDDCCDGFCDSPCSPWGGFWGRAEYLQWWVRGSRTPALVTTSPDGTPAGVAGVLPGATVLFGDERINTQGRSGGRFTLGYWFGNCECMGVENTFFFLGNAHESYQNSSNGSPILARPFFNVNTGDQDAVLTAFPNVVVGRINVTSTSRVYGNEVNVRRVLYADQCRRVDLLAGYRFFQLNEGLQVATNTTSIDPQGTVPVGTTFGIVDSFLAHNQFNGGQLGFNTQYWNGRWSFDFLLKLALGNMSQRVTINGSTVVTVPESAPVTNQGGIFVQNSNIGQFNRNAFSLMPEFGTNLHYQFAPLWRVNLGYTLLVVTNVARPGDQIDTRLDPNQFPPPASSGSFTFPQFAFHNSDIWLQGLNVGLECNF